MSNVRLTGEPRGDTSMMKVMLIPALAALSLVAIQPASAALLTFEATLNGGQQVPPVSTTGVGTGLLTVDTTTQTFDVAATFSGLTSPTTMAHIHVSPPGLNGPIVLPFAGFPLGVTSGSYSHDFSASDLPTGFTFTDFVSDLQSRDAYFNIHTVAYPGGEIRGNIVTAISTVPLPASAPMFGAALLGLAGLGYGMKRRAAPRGKTEAAVA